MKYTYDTAGNRITESRDGENITYIPNKWNQITSRTAPSETTTYQYDDNGNLISETSSLSGTKTYAYDYENRLSIVNSPQSTVRYAYSGDGKRISSTTNGTVVQYLYDGMSPVVERDASNTTLAVYTRIPAAPGGIGGLISSLSTVNGQPSTAYYHCSHLGNVNQITDSSGNVIQTYDYDAFGNVVVQSGSLSNAYKYKTKETSLDTGLIYFGSRYYNPLLGRFITPDPLGLVDGVNVYLYCGNDPINYIDTYGLCGDTPWWFIVGGMSLATPWPGDEELVWGAIGTGFAIWGIYEGGKWIINWAREATREGPDINVGKKLSEEEAVNRVKNGGDVMSDSQEEAERIARKAGGGKEPVHENPHKPGYSPHYHSHGHGAGHVFY